MKLLTTTKQITSMHFFFASFLRLELLLYNTCFWCFWGCIHCNMIFVQKWIYQSHCWAQSIGLCAIEFGCRTPSNTVLRSEFNWFRNQTHKVQCSILCDCRTQSNEIHGLCLIKFDFQTFDWLCWDSAQDVFFSSVRNFPRLKKTACTRDVLHRSNN